MEVSAAVVHSFDHPPRYEPFDLPAPADEDEVVLDVLAVGLHPRVRSGAAGRHYTSTGKLPMVPGVDGVGRLPDGRLVYVYLEELPELVNEIDQGRIAVSARIVPLAEVESAWTAPERPGVRTVLVTEEA